MCGWNSDAEVGCAPQMDGNIGQAVNYENTEDNYTGWCQ